MLNDILGPEGAIARRMGPRYEHRPQQLEMASAVGNAFAEGHHLLVEAGTGVGKSFAYLLPAIDFAVKQKKRVVISTHTISLQEQLIEKDIPLIQSVYPDEFTAILVKGRGNYLCQRRLDQARTRQNALFDNETELESLWMIEEWATHTTDGSQADLPRIPELAVWERVNAEQGNCLGKKCKHYNDCFWQAAKRRMQSGTILIVNHALFFSDLSLRMVGVNYLPKYDLVILDEAHTVEDVAGEHFGLRISEGSIRYNLRTLYDLKRGKGMLSTHGSRANGAIQDIIELDETVANFFARVIQWQESAGRKNGRVQQPHVVPNDLSPKLRDLGKRIKMLMGTLAEEAVEEISELNSISEKIKAMAETVEAIMSHSLADAVYWFDVSGRGPKRVSLHAAPIDVAQGLRTNLFEKTRSVVLTSATMCTSRGGSKGEVAKSVHRLDGRDGHVTGGVGNVGTVSRDTAVSAVRATQSDEELRTRQGAHLPHWTKRGSVYAVNFRLADALPNGVLERWTRERDAITKNAREQNRPLSFAESKKLDKLHSKKVETFLDAGHGECYLRQDEIAQIVANALKHFDGHRYQLLAWCVMPNHVHAVVQPHPEHDLASIIHSWKSFTAHEANRILNRTGDFWMDEYYDHLIRDEAELRHSVEYAFSNSEQAGLTEWKWRGTNEPVIQELLGVNIAPHGRDDHVTGKDAPNLDDKNDSRDTAVSAVQATSQITDPAFSYIASRLGVENAQTLQLGSPFNFEKQATLYIESDLPEPSDTARFLPAAGEKILHYVRQTNGGAFVLFTSYSMLIESANRLKATIDAMGLPLLVQGQGAPRKVLLERFRSTENAVLFGTASFWQGIDVQGDALRNVIIVKLPFDVPDEPIIEARLEAIQRHGGNPFMDYSVPQAVIRLKQGFGRLIRSKTDTGIVAILDSRAKTKRYGKLFLNALPACRIVEVGASTRKSQRENDESQINEGSD